MIKSEFRSNWLFYFEIRSRWFFSVAKESLQSLNKILKFSTIAWIQINFFKNRKNAPLPITWPFSMVSIWTVIFIIRKWKFKDCSNKYFHRFFSPLQIMFKRLRLCVVYKATPSEINFQMIFSRCTNNKMNSKWNEWRLKSLFIGQHIYS